jgi:hypothetical protein
MAESGIEADVRRPDLVDGEWNLLQVLTNS